ncbi:MAG: hypothetical protein AABZ47_10035 [Planctomycetota bacterium]
MLVEADTLTAALEGEREALGRVLVACDPELRRHLSGRIGSAYQSAVAIDDVLQVTYIEGCLRIGTLEERTIEGLLRWLKVVAENNLKDAIRALNAARRPPRKKHVGASLEESAATFLAEFVGSDTTPTYGARRSEIADLLERALSGMPPDYQRAIRFYDLQGGSIVDVAAAFEPPRSTGAVHMLRARAFDRLRELLGDTSRFFSGTA